MKQDYTLRNTLNSNQKARLTTPSYKLKKEKESDEKDIGNDSLPLIDQDHVTVLGAVNPKSPEKVIKEKQNTKMSAPAKSSVDKDLKPLDAKCSERFLRLEAMLMANILGTEPTVKVTPTKKPAAGAVDILSPFLPPT